MDGIWTLAVCLGVVCCAVPGSTQDSPRPLFLIWSPEMLHAGTPTPLAVTTLADFVGRVTAVVTHGNSKVIQAQTEGGLTRILMLPPISGPLSQDSPLNLTVSGYMGDSLIFTNTTSLSFSLRNVSTVIQTDKSSYQPDDTVRVRAVSVQWDNQPYKGRVELSVQDPSGYITDRWESTGNLGIVLREFTLSHTAPLGQWAITATVNGVAIVRRFTVEYYDHPHFEVLLKTPPQVLIGDDISGSVRALYPSGQPVQGALSISVTAASVHSAASPLTQTQTKEIYGSTRFFFSKDLLQVLYFSSGISSGLHLHVVASVTDNSTGFKVNKTSQVHLMTNTFQLTFHDFPATLKPSLHFSSKLRISRFDRSPLSSTDLLHSAVIEVAQTSSTMTSEPTTLMLPVPEDGTVHIEFELQERVEMLSVQARFQSNEETLRVYNNYSSPSGSYIQISTINSLPAQIGLPLQLNVESTFQPAQLHFVVSSRGQVVAAGTKTSSSFSLTPTLSWSPEACVTVYCILSDGEVASDTAHIAIDQHNYVSLNWSSDKAQPGERVSLTVTALEARAQVGVLVMGTHSDSPQDLPDEKAEQECSLKMLSNAKVHQKKQTDGPKHGEDVPLLEKYWSHWTDATESLLWLDTDISDGTWTTGEITVPDGVASLRAVALVMSDNLGLGFTPVPQKLSVSKDFSMSLDVPSHLIRGEEIVLQVNIINHLEDDTEVILLLAKSEAFEFVLADTGDFSVVNALKLNLRSHASASALFPIRPVALGVMEITVDAVSAEGSDSLVWSVLVKPEGVERSYSETLFLELASVNHNNAASISFSFPPDVVPGSQRAHVALVGDILSLSLENLDSLVQMPVGCGEQNMIHFAPSVYILKYLDMSSQDDEDIRSRALGYMKEGYQRQMSYLRDDGSFSAFGASSSSGSTWLTAFVLRCFLQAQSLMQVEQSILSGAMTWLLQHQGPQGEFREVGRLMHTEMQGGLDGDPVALTAYVLTALLEDDSYVEMFSANVSLAKRYLEGKVSSGGLSNYTLCLAAYALSLASSPVAGTALTELNMRADYKDGVTMWSSSAGPQTRDGRPRSAQVEMASYVLLAHVRRGNSELGFALMKWLTKQRNHLGGYGTTQDTVVALQALVFYAAISGSSSINLRLNISSPSFSSVPQFSINSTTYRKYQSREIDASKDIDLSIDMEGIGFALLQMNIFYNLESKAFSQSLQRGTQEEAFSLDVDVAEEADHDHMLLSVCMKLKDSQPIPQTGMAMLDVGVLSGFSLSPGAAPTDLIRKVEVLPERVSLYLDSLTKSEVCVRLPFLRDYKVAHVQDAVVQVYDYYEPTRRATRMYNSPALQNMNSCFFCGENCDLCRPGITVTVSSSLSSHSERSVTSSLMFLFLGVAPLFAPI